MKRLGAARQIGLTAGVLGLLCFTPWALGAPAKLSAQATYWGGVEYDDGDTAINRLSLRSQLKKRWGRNLQLDMAAQIDWSKDSAGLGSTSNYAPLSKPLLRTDHIRGQL